VPGKLPIHQSLFPASLLLQSLLFAAPVLLHIDPKQF
jgi:hypothetical protein